MNPWLWLGILVTGIVGVYAWEYRQNPGQLPWQIGTTGRGVTGDATSTDVLLESLTPEEQAVAVELDNVELLLAQLDSDVSALTSGGESSAAASLNAALADAAGETRESSVERLTRYIDEYSFLGAGARGSNIDQADVQVQQPSESVLTFQPDADTQPEEAPPSNVLAEALARQQAAAETATSPEISVDSRGLPVTEETADDAADTPTFSFDQTGVVPGSLDGLNQTFIRTTPSMSPPPGTTGYVPPASLPTFSQQNRAAGIAPVPAQSSFGSFDQSSPAVPDRSQALPPGEISTTPQLETPVLGGASQAAPTQPRNAWESFWD
ncbi:hypothetical protein N836_05315 [Leptolyngbya sp. Heron Island J]|uniref:hypothetical protein n=1 Tax=Leptolyngbya sp. Heron Island J TaxID=1385935 RepID=UPI0003B9CC33|nr:hypothetical protein [Leptolyngbya sp. Heron Island J]ESA36982.1 hypothetical protein N836_05315 [Leptolyngbya sp. Heron Island J]